MAMGFDTGSGRNDTPRKESRNLPQANCLLRFDSGEGISFDDATHHLLILGTTGSGKTASAFLPAVARLLEAGHCGLVVDIKDNVRAQVRALAARCGREADIVEYGTGPDAVPLNILHGMDRHAMHGFFEGLFMSSIRGHTEHFDWHVRGIKVAADCGYLLGQLHALDPMYEPNVTTISEMLMRPDEAVKLYKLFKARIYDPDNEEHALFVGGVEANRFHVLKFRSDETGNGKKTTDTTVEEQMTWTLQGITGALKSFLDAPGVGGHFAAHGAPGLDLGHVLTGNRIVLLHCSRQTGPIGATLARVLLARMYAAIYATGRQLPAGRKCFVAIDEFQEAADLSDGRYSDTSFVSQAREYNGIFMAATQSMSAMMHCGNSPHSVEAFTSNCNGRIIFYSDDPLTMAMAGRYDSKVELNSLEPGTAFVVRYDKGTRRHTFGAETFQEAFATTSDLLGIGSEPTPVGAVTTAERPTLRALTEWADDELKGRHGRGVQEQPRQPMRHVLMREIPARQLEGTTMRKNGGTVRMDDGQPAAQEAQHPEKPAQPAKPRRRKNLVDKVPQFFAGDEASVSIPVGWVEFAERVFAVIAATGLDVSIASVGLSGNRLRAAEADGRMHHMDSGATRFLNELLERSQSICALCGEVLEMPDREQAEEEDDDDEFVTRHRRSKDDDLPLCGKCLQQFGLGFVRPDPRAQSTHRPRG